MPKHLLPSVDGVGHAFGLVEELHQLVRQLHLPGLAAQLEIALGVMNLEIERRFSGAVLHGRHEVAHHGGVDGIAVDQDSDFVDVLVLHRLHILDVGNAQLVEVGVAVAPLRLGGDVHRARLLQRAAPFAPLLAEERQFARAREVLDGNEATRTAIAAELRLHRCHHTAEGDDVFLGQFLLVAQFGTGGVAHVLQNHAVLIERMGREIDAHQVALAVQALDIAPGVALGDGRCGYLHHVASEERHLRLHLLGLEMLAEAHERVEEHLALDVGRQIALAGDAEAVEPAAEHQALNGLAVHGREVHALHQVEHVGVWSTRLALGDDGLGGSGAHALDGSQSETDGALLVHAELVAALVHVGSEGLDAHGLALVHELGDFGDVVQVAAHHGGHILRWVVGLEVGRLVGHPRVAGGVALVEGIRGKLLPVFPNLVEHALVVAVFRSAFVEQRLELVHLLYLLLSHGLAQRVRLASGEVGKLSGEQHHLR